MRKISKSFKYILAILALFSVASVAFAYPTPSTLWQNISGVLNTVPVGLAVRVGSLTCTGSPCGTGGGGSGVTIGDSISGGTPNEILYGDGSGNVAQSSNLYFDGTHTGIGGSFSDSALTVKNLNTPAIGTANFQGGTLNDLTSGGTYTGTRNDTYIVTITTGDPTSPNEYSWTSTNGDNGGSVAIDGTAQAIGSLGVTGTFANKSGHTTGDSWSISVSTQQALSVLASNGQTALELNDDGFFDVQNTTTGNGMLEIAPDPSGADTSSYILGDADLGSLHDIFGTTENEDNSLDGQSVFHVDGSLSGVLTDPRWLDIQQTGSLAGLIKIGDSKNVVSANPGNELDLDSASGNQTLKTSGEFEINSTDSLGGQSILFASPAQEVVNLGDWNNTENKTALKLDDTSGTQSITAITDGFFAVNGATSGRKLFNVDGTAEVTTVGSSFQVFDGNNHVVLQSNGGVGSDGKTTIGDVGNNVDNWKLVTDPYASTPNGSQGTTTFTGFHGDVEKIYTDGIQATKPTSLSYASQSTVPTGGNFDLGANVVTLTASSKTINLFGTNNSTGSQWYNGAVVVLNIGGSGDIIKNNQTPATGYASIKLANGADYNASQGDILTFEYDGSVWNQTAVSHNTTQTNPSICGTPGNLTAQSAAVSSITTCTPSVNTTIDLSAYLTVTAVSVNTITTQVTYTDETNTSRTVSLFNMGTTVAAIGATGASSYPVTTIRVKGGTTATAKTVVVGAGSETYDVGATFTLAQ